MEIDPNEVNKILSQYKGKKGALIPVLQRIQEEFGWVPPKVLEDIANSLKVFPSEVYGVATFYSQFYLKPKGRNRIHICLGTACYVKRAEDILNQIRTELKIKVDEVTEDRRFSIDTVRCLGACGLAPIMVINHDIYGSVKPRSIKRILSKYE